MAKGRGRREDNGESIAGYFRKIFDENPKLLKTRSNEEVLRRWLADHPGHNEVPPRIKNGLMNVKSLLRRKGRRRGRRKMLLAQGQPGGAVPAATRRPVRGLEQLEEQIDDCLTAARTLDREGLDQVIRLLRHARNQIVWKLGQ
jgi:hypothetical protein